MKNKKLLEKILILRKSGFSYRQIGKALNKDHAYIFRLHKQYKLLTCGKNKKTKVLTKK